MDLVVCPSKSCFSQLLQIFIAKFGYCRRVSSAIWVYCVKMMEAKITQFSLKSSNF